LEAKDSDTSAEEAIETLDDQQNKPPLVSFKDEKLKPKTIIIMVVSAAIILFILIMFVVLVTHYFVL